MAAYLGIAEDVCKEWLQKYKEGSFLLVRAVERIDEPEGKRPTKKVTLDVVANSEKNESLSDFEKRLKRDYDGRSDIYRQFLFVYKVKPDNSGATPLYPNAELEVKKKFLGLPG